MIKLIATDLDGTLATHEGKIPEEAFGVISQLASKGIKFVVATGRQTATVENDFRDVLQHIYVVTENGGVVRHQEQDIHAAYLDYQKVQEVIQELLKQPDLQFVVCCKDKAYQSADTERFNKELDKYYHSREVVADLLAIQEPVIKIAIYHHEDITKEIQPFVQQKWAKDFKLTISGLNWLDMGCFSVNKGKAIEILQQDLGINKEECMAFGDYFNDVEMLAQVGHSYAMEHAPAGVKASAKYTALTGGVLQIIKDKVLD